jgi:hypothetical protein
MTTAVAALASMLGDGEGRTKVLLVVPNAPAGFVRRFVQLLESSIGVPPGSVRLHRNWSVSVAKACAASPHAVDILFHDSSDAAGMDMGMLDCIVTIGKIPNKQQLYSRALRTGTQHRAKLKVAQVEKHDYNASSRWFPAANRPLFPSAPIATVSRRQPPADVEYARDASEGALGRFLAECLSAEEEDGVMGDGGAYDASVVDKVVVTYVKPRAGPAVSYEEIEAVSTPRVKHVNGTGQRMDVEFYSVVKCELIPAAADAIMLSLEGSGWTARWISTTAVDPPPARCRGAGRSIRIRFRTSKGGVLKMFELEAIEQ